MGFFMDGLDAEGYDRKYSDVQLVKRIVGYFRPQFRRMLVVAGAVVLTSLSQTFLPVYISRSLDQLQQNGAAANLTTITLVITLLACAAWGFNYIRGWQSSKAVGDVVLEDPLRRLRRGLETRPVLLRRDLVRQNRQPGDLGHAVLFTGGHPDHGPAQPAAVHRAADDLFVQRQRAPGADDPGAGAVHHGWRRWPSGASPATPSPNRAAINSEVSSHIQETVSGISVAKTFRQEAVDLRRVPQGQPAFLPGQPADGFRLQRHLSDPQHPDRGRHGRPGVFRRAKRPAGHRSAPGIGICSSRASPCS